VHLGGKELALGLQVGLNVFRQGLDALGLGATPLLSGASG